MASHTIRIITDKSPVAHRHATLLAKGVESSIQNKPYKVVIGDLARTPDDAANEQTALEDINIHNADVLLFASTGALALFEKHFQEEERHPLHSKTIGVVLFSQSTFDDAGSSHPTDKHLVDDLNQYGLERDAILLKVQNDQDEQELYELGRRFVEQISTK